MLLSLAGSPAPLTPIYRTPEVNADVPLYCGLVELSGCSQTHQKEATLRLAWLPSPRIEIVVQDFNWLEIFDGKVETLVTVPGHSQPYAIVWTGLRLSGGDAAKPPATIGRLDSGHTFADSKLKSILFHVANGPECQVKPLVSLEASPWRVSYSEVPGLRADAFPAQRRASAGYSITHVGRLERTDGQSFDGTDADEALAAIGFFLSFCRGAWTFPMLLVGEATDGSEPVQNWRCPRIDAAPTHRSWFNHLSSDGFGAIGGLVAKLAEPIWNETIRLALHWYVVCNKPDSVSIEGAIVLQQTAFELLAWTLLVDERKILSTDGIQKLPASDRIRLLLSSCGIPLEIPPGLSDLATVAKAENWQDGPHATTEIRNALVHASPKKRARIFGHGNGSRTDAWTLGQWYLELILLRLFDYNADYSSRLRRGVLENEAVRAVPWVKDGVG